MSQKWRKWVLLKYCMEWKREIDSMCPCARPISRACLLRSKTVCHVDIESFDQSDKSDNGTIAREMESSSTVKFIQGVRRITVLAHLSSWIKFIFLVNPSSLISTFFYWFTSLTIFSSNLQQIQQIVLLRNWWLFILLQHLWKIGKTQHTP